MEARTGRRVSVSRCVEQVQFHRLNAPTRADGNSVRGDVEAAVRRHEPIVSLHRRRLSGFHSYPLAQFSLSATYKTKQS